MEVLFGVSSHEHNKKCINGRKKCITYFTLIDFLSISDFKNVIVAVTIDTDETIWFKFCFLHISNFKNVIVTVHIIETT